MDNFGFLKVAAAVPHVRVADCDYNTERMAAMAEEAARRGVEIVAFPELGVTAYTCGDLLLQQTLLDAADEALERLVRATRKLPLTLIAGAPLRHGSTLYNCAVVFTQGKVLGVVPKTEFLLSQKSQIERELKEENATYAELADYYKVSLSGFKRFIRENIPNLPSRRKKKNDTE